MSAPRPLDVMVVGDLFTELVMSGFSSWPGRAGEELFAVVESTESSVLVCVRRTWPSGSRRACPTRRKNSETGPG